MNYLTSEGDYQRLVWVLGLNNLLRGVSQGVIIPGLLWTIQELNVSESWFLLGIALLESLQVVGKLMIYLNHSWSFSKSAYWKLILLSILSASLYIGCFYRLGLASLIFSLALQGLWMGSLDKIEAILITEISSQSVDTHKEILKTMKGLGLIIGPVVGCFSSSFTDLKVLDFDIKSLSIPGLIQLSCSILMLMIYVSIPFQFFTPSALKVPSDQRYFNRTESLALGSSSMRLNKKIDSSHLSIFTAMFIALIFSMARSIKEVALPVLTIDNQDAFSGCKCSQTYGLEGVYLLFAGAAAFEFISVFLLYRLKNIEAKYQIFLPLVLGVAGQSLMITKTNVYIDYLVAGIALQSLAIPLGISNAGNFLHEIIGNEPPAYFTIVWMILELIGSLIGPFWTMQAYMVKCGLCFSLISFCVALSIFLMIISIFQMRANEKLQLIKDLSREQNDFKTKIHKSTTDVKPNSRLPSMKKYDSEGYTLEMTNFKKIL